MNTQLSITNILTSAFKVFSKNWVKIVLGQLFVLVVTFLPLLAIFIAFFIGFGVKGIMFNASGFPVSLIISAAIVLILYIVYATYIQAGLIKFYLDIYNGSDPKITAILKTSKKDFCRYFVFSLTLFFIILGGFILLIIPAIIFGIMFSVARFYVIEKGFTTKQALQASKDATKGYRVEIFVFALTMIALYILVSFAKNIGSLVSFFVLQPVFLLAFVYIYKQLSTTKTTTSDTHVDEKKETEAETDIAIQPQELESGHQEDVQK